MNRINLLTDDRRAKHSIVLAKRFIHERIFEFIKFKTKYTPSSSSPYLNNSQLCQLCALNVAALIRLIASVRKHNNKEAV
jgi:hypothetical protein